MSRRSISDWRRGSRNGSLSVHFVSRAGLLCHGIAGAISSRSGLEEYAKVVGDGLWGVDVDEAEPHRRGSSPARQLSQLPTSLERARYSSLALDEYEALHDGDVHGVLRGGAIHPVFLNAPTNWSNVEPPSPDSAHRPRLADVALLIAPIVGLPHLTSSA